jgi:hypothetical protein
MNVLLLDHHNNRTKKSSLTVIYEVGGNTSLRENPSGINLYRIGDRLHLHNRFSYVPSSWSMFASEAAHIPDEAPEPRRRLYCIVHRTCEKFGGSLPGRHTLLAHIGLNVDANSDPGPQQIMSRD